MKNQMFVLILFPFLLFSPGIEDAKTYHSNSTLQWRVALEALDLFSWDTSERVLDVGCGDGKITALISEKVPQGTVLGVDISQSMIDFASDRYSPIDYPNLRFLCQGACEITFENLFDRIVSFSTLHWVLDQEEALRRMYKALVAGGKVCLHTYGKGQMYVTEIGDSLVHTDRWQPHFTSYKKQRVFYTQSEYQTLLERSGFHHVQVEGCWDESVFSNRQALLDFAKPLLNFIRHLPMDLQQEFAEDVVDQILSLAGVSPDGSIHYLTYNLYALGFK